MGKWETWLPVMKSTNSTFHTWQLSLSLFNTISHFWLTRSSQQKYHQNSELMIWYNFFLFLSLIHSIYLSILASKLCINQLSAVLYRLKSVRFGSFQEWPIYYTIHSSQLFFIFFWNDLFWNTSTYHTRANTCLSLAAILDSEGDWQ